MNLLIFAPEVLLQIQGKALRKRSSTFVEQDARFLACRSAKGQVEFSIAVQVSQGEPASAARQGEWQLRLLAEVREVGLRAGRRARPTDVPSNKPRSRCFRGGWTFTLRGFADRHATIHR